MHVTVDSMNDKPQVWDVYKEYKLKNSTGNNILAYQSTEYPLRLSEKDKSTDIKNG